MEKRNSVNQILFEKGIKKMNENTISNEMVNTVIDEVNNADLNSWAEKGCYGLAGFVVGYSFHKFVTPKLKALAENRKAKKAAKLGTNKVGEDFDEDFETDFREEN